MAAQPYTSAPLDFNYATAIGVTGATICTSATSGIAITDNAANTTTVAAHAAGGHELVLGTAALPIHTLTGSVPCFQTTLTALGAGNVAFTAANIFTSLPIISVTPGGAATLTTPTGAQLEAALPVTAAVGICFPFWILNENGAAAASTLTAGDAAVTVRGTAAVAANTLRPALLRRTGLNTYDIML